MGKRNHSDRQPTGGAVFQFLLKHGVPKDVATAIATALIYRP